MNRKDVTKPLRLEGRNVTCGIEILFYLKTYAQHNIVFHRRCENVYKI